MARVRCRRRAHIDRRGICPEHILDVAKPCDRDAKANLCRTRGVARWGHFHRSGAAGEEVGFRVRARCGGGTRHRPPTIRVGDMYAHSGIGEAAAHHAPECGQHMEDAPNTGVGHVCLCRGVRPSRRQAADAPGIAVGGVVVSTLDLRSPPHTCPAAAPSAARRWATSIDSASGSHRCCKNEW